MSDQEFDNLEIEPLSDDALESVAGGTSDGSSGSCCSCCGCSSSKDESLDALPVSGCSAS